MSGRHALDDFHTLVGVWAHPDDEAYLSAALMATLRAKGRRVVVVTATAGEQGTDDPVRWPPERLARRRRRELVASLAALGVHEHRFLGFADGGCSTVPAAVGADRIGRVLDEVRPDAVVTFGPDGMTGHPDHRAVSAWTTLAWHDRGDEGRLWYATLTPSFHERWGALNAELGMWAYGRPPCTPDDELAVQVRGSDEVLDRKLRALRAHASQSHGIVERVGVDTFRRWWAVESFVDGAPSLVGPGAGRPSISATG